MADIAPESAVVALVLECPRRAGPTDHAHGHLIHGFTRYRPGALACFMAEVFDEPGTVYRVGFYPSEAQARLNGRAQCRRAREVWSADPEDRE